MTIRSWQRCTLVELGAWLQEIRRHPDTGSGGWGATLQAFAAELKRRAEQDPAKCFAEAQSIIRDVDDIEILGSAMQILRYLLPQARPLAPALAERIKGADWFGSEFFATGLVQLICLLDEDVARTMLQEIGAMQEGSWAAEWMAGGCLEQWTERRHAGAQLEPQA